MLVVLSVHINVRFLSDNFTHRILQSQLLPPTLGRALQEPQYFYRFCYSQTCGPQEWPDFSLVFIIWVSPVRFICQGSLQGNGKLALEQHNILSFMDCIGGTRKHISKSVFVCCYFWPHSGVDKVSVFLDYRAALYPRRKDTLYTFVLFVCLFVNNMWWKEEEMKLLLELQTHPPRNIKQAYNTQEDQRVEAIYTITNWYIIHRYRKSTLPEVT